VIERLGSSCHICGRGVDLSAWHMDHVIPLDHGGPHCYANVAPAHPFCNVSKHARWGGSPVAAVDAAAREAFLSFHGRPY
jgi:5-methylcytosine-specific restriction endonuclease McrA